MVKFETKAMKDCHDVYLKCDLFLFGDVFNKFKSNSLKNMDNVQVIIEPIRCKLGCNA